MKNNRTIIGYAIILIFSCTFYPQTLKAQAPNWGWAKTAGSTGWDYAGGLDYNSSTIATDAQGNSYVTGLFNGAATFGTVSISSPSHPDVFVAKYDVAGNCAWVHKFGGLNTDVYGNEGKSIAVDEAGNCYVTGTFNGPTGNTIPFGSSVLMGTGNREIFVVKYDAAGNEMWASQPTNSGPANNYAKSIAVDAAGNAYITGYLGGGTNTFGSMILNGGGAYVIKYSTSGIAQWATKIGSAGSADGISLAIDANGNSYVTGYLQGNETFATIPVTSITSSGNRDIFLAKVGTTGTLIWVKNFGAAAGSAVAPFNPVAYGKGVSVDGLGNVFLTGDFEVNLVLGATTLTASGSSGSEAYVAKLDLNGNPIWARQSLSSSGNMGDVRGTAIKANNAGDCFFTGYYYPSSFPSVSSFCGVTFPSVGNQTMYVLKINANGTTAWGQFSSGNGSSCIPAGISIDSFNNTYIAGNNQGTQVIGANTITSFGGFDVLICKINSATTSTVATSLREIEKEVNVTVYPNPFSTSASVNITGFEGEGVLNMKIYDLMGREVKSFENVSASTFYFDRSDMSAGIYSFKLSINNEILKTGKIIAE